MGLNHLGSKKLVLLFALKRNLLVEVGFSHDVVFLKLEVNSKDGTHIELGFDTDHAIKYLTNAFRNAQP